MFYHSLPLRFEASWPEGRRKYSRQILSCYKLINHFLSFIHIEKGNNSNLATFRSCIEPWSVGKCWRVISGVLPNRDILSERHNTQKERGRMKRQKHRDNMIHKMDGETNGELVERWVVRAELIMQFLRSAWCECVLSWVQWRKGSKRSRLKS